MLSAVLSFLTGPGGLYALLTAAVGVGVLWLRRDARKDERNAQKAKEADAYAKHLKELEDASNARAGVKPGKLPDDDHYRRD